MILSSTMPAFRNGRDSYPGTYRLKSCCIPLSRLCIRQQGTHIFGNQFSRLLRHISVPRYRSPGQPPLKPLPYFSLYSCQWIPECQIHFLPFFNHRHCGQVSFLNGNLHMTGAGGFSPICYWPLCNFRNHICCVLFCLFYIIPLAPVRKRSGVC